MEAVKKKLKVVYVEDDAKWFNKVRNCVLEMPGFEFCEIGTVNKFDLAMDNIEYCRPDIVILDHAVDGFCGYHIAHELKNDERFAKVKIISFSGSNTDSIRKKYPVTVRLYAEKDLGKLRRYLREILIEANL